MRRLLLAIALLATAPAIAQPSPLELSSPVELAITADPPDPMPAGGDQRIQVTVQRQTLGEPTPGPGEAELVLQAPEPAGCGPDTQTVRLDATTGQARAELACQPARPGSWNLTLEAHTQGARSGTWMSELGVHPDTLEGQLALGEPEAYRVPVNLSLAPEHLAQAPVEVAVLATMQGAPLGFEEAFTASADGSVIHHELLARHGPGDYAIAVTATGPLTRDWRAQANVSVPAPPPDAHLELNATVEPGEPEVSLASDSVNDDGKTKRPGDELITRLDTAYAEEVNVTVLRAEGEATVALARDTLTVDADGSAEHVFAQDPLPAGRLWVQAEVGDSAVARTAQIRDLDARAELEGPEHLLGDGRPWQGTLVLADRNLGSTPLDPGPVFGLPDVSWTLYRYTSPAEGFHVELGPFAGASEGEAETSRIPWPQGTETVEVEPGRAKLPITVTPPGPVEPGTYRLSLYAPDGDRIGGGSWDVQAPPSVGLDVGQPVPGRGLPIGVQISDPVDEMRMNLTLAVDEAPVANLTLNGTDQAEPTLPVPIHAGANVTVQAHADWPGRPSPGQADASVTRVVPELAPNVSAHPVLDGVATRAPVPVHPAAGHLLELVASAFDPNEGPVNVSDVSIHGPDGSVDWPIEEDERPIRVHVPAQVSPGRYEVEITAGQDPVGQARVPLEVAPTLRLGVEGPGQLSVPQDGTQQVNLTLTNRGSLPIQEATLFAETDLALEVSAWNGTGWVPPGQPVAVGLEPAQQAQIPVRVEASGDPGQGSLGLTLAGVVR